jgi:hypothetical protein
MTVGRVLGAPHGQRRREVPPYRYAVNLREKGMPIENRIGKTNLYHSRRKRLGRGEFAQELAFAYFFFLPKRRLSIAMQGALAGQATEKSFHVLPIRQRIRGRFSGPGRWKNSTPTIGAVLFNNHTKRNIFSLHFANGRRSFLREIRCCNHRFRVIN